MLFAVFYSPRCNYYFTMSFTFACCLLLATELVLCEVKCQFIPDFNVDPMPPFVRW